MKIYKKHQNAVRVQKKTIKTNQKPIKCCEGPIKTNIPGSGGSAGEGWSGELALPGQPILQILESYCFDVVLFCDLFVFDVYGQLI